MEVVYEKAGYSTDITWAQPGFISILEMVGCEGFDVD